MSFGSAFGRATLVTIFSVLAIIRWFILIWVILSWVVFFASNTSFRWRYRTAFNILAQLNEFFTRAASPILRPFRRILPPHKTGGIDFSPILLLLLIFFIETFLRNLVGPIL